MHIELPQSLFRKYLNRPNSVMYARKSTPSSTRATFLNRQVSHNTSIPPKAISLKHGHCAAVLFSLKILSTVGCECPGTSSLDAIYDAVALKNNLTKTSVTQKTVNHGNQ